MTSRTHERQTAGFDYQQENAETIDRWVSEGWEWGRPVTHEQFAAAQKGDWDIVLTPTKPVPRSWFEGLPTPDGGLTGARVLGLASGGGQQMPILTAAGAVCTVLDYSPAQLESERQMAGRESYAITCVRADMTKPLPLPDASFDLVVNPVSMCYIREIEPVFREISRILRPGGVVLTGQDSGINYIVDDAEERIIRGLPYDPVADPKLLEQARADDDGVQFSHTAGEEISAVLHAGLRVTDVFEDTNGDGRLDRLGIPSFLAIRAVKE
jgi:SAM-dependent methyltransferase